MPITNTGAFGQYRRMYNAVVTTANSNYTTPSNTALVAVAGPDGALITNLTVQPRATVTGNPQIQFYLSKDGGTTFSFINTAQVDAVTFSVTTQISPVGVTQLDGTTLSDTNPMALGGLTDFGSTAPTWGGLSTGSANAQTLPFASGVTALTAGLIVDFEAGLTNTTSMTLTVGTAPAASLVRDSSGSAVSAGDVTTGFRYRARCDGSFWRLFITDRLYAATGVTLADGFSITAQQTDF